MPDSKSSLQAADRIFDVLESFTVENPEWGITDLANRLGLNKSVVHRIATELVARGYLRQNPSNRAYRLGLRCLQLGATAFQLNDVRSVARPHMEQLVNDTNESVMLHMRDGHEGMCIETVETPQGIRCMTRVGSRTPLHAGGISKVLIAFLPEEEQDKILSHGLKKFTEHTTTDVATLKQQFEEIRRLGYSVTVGEVDADAMGPAAPIRDAAGKVIASIGIAAPTFRVNEERLQQFISLTVKAAEQISRDLGYRRP